MILVENGILNPDYTPNEATAARLGWRLEEKEVRTCPLPEEGQKAIPLQSAVQAEDEKEVKDTMAVLKAKAAFRAGLEKRH